MEVLTTQVEVNSEMSCLDLWVEAKIIDFDQLSRARILSEHIFRITKSGHEPEASEILHLR